MKKHPLIMYGGAFNPPHLDHAGIIETLLQNTAEKVLIIPTGKRDDKEYGTTGNNREDMIRLATEEYGQGVEIDTTFLYGNMPTTTLTQASYLREKYGRDIPQVFGSDVAPHMIDWDPTGYVAHELPKVFVRRPHHQMSPEDVSNYETIEYVSHGFSSTDIRKEVSKILAGASDIQLLRGKIHEKVLEYILSNRLFYLLK